MKYPSISNVKQYKALTTVFGGINVNPSCMDGEFNDMQNMTADDYPVLSTRAKRRIQKNAGKGVWGITQDGSARIEDTAFLSSGEIIAELVYKTKVIQMQGITFERGSKQMLRMGAYVVIFPDKVWFNTKDETYGKIEAEKVIASGNQIKFEVTNADHAAITWKDESYYKDHTPKDGDYMMVTKDGKSSLKVYYKALSMWSSVATTYLKITATDIGKNFDEDDGLKIIVDNSVSKWDEADKVFLNKEDDGKLSMNTYIVKKEDDYIIIPGIIKENKTLSNMPMSLLRKCPDMDYVVEYQNRIWGCSSANHEVYCSKQGDPKNFNYYKGVSLDSWAATVGSSGDFTGACVFNQNPIFFKEDEMLRISVSPSGAHSYREVKCPGVGSTNHMSIATSDRAIYYAGSNGIYEYDGSVPQRISDNLGFDRPNQTNPWFGGMNVKYAVGFMVGPKYYLCIDNKISLKRELYVYDSRFNVWMKEDNLDVKFAYDLAGGFKAVYAGDDRIFLDGQGFGDASFEKSFPWFIESGNIGYQETEKKFIAKMNVRMMLEVGAYADIWIQYDSSGSWEHLYNISGKGTKSFTIPIKTKRCDHFKYKISGRGSAKIFAISKMIEEGSDY